MSWKTVLYDYVHTRNQMEVEYSAEPLASFVADEAYLNNQQRTMHQLLDSAKERRLNRLKNETGLILRNVQETGEAVNVDIELRRTFHYEIKRESHMERRIEHERIILCPAQGRWRISKITPTAEFNHDSGISAFLQIEAQERWIDSDPFPSVPYMNYSILNRVESSPRKIQYDRIKAVKYADTWWNGANPQYIPFEDDCTNFVSQCLFAGGAPMNYTGKRESGWWYAGKKGSQELWSFSWAVAQSLQAYISRSKSGGLYGSMVHSAWELQPGDMISYDWNGDGRYTHSTFVTAKDANGMPLVNAHTVNSYHRYWEYKDSYAWTPKTRYSFLHIADEM